MNQKKVDFDSVIVPKMKEAIKDTLEAFWLRVQKEDHNKIIN